MKYKKDDLSLENGIKKAIIQNINALYVDKNQYGKERN